jgi:hypothetical protein
MNIRQKPELLKSGKSAHPGRVAIKRFRPHPEFSLYVIFPGIRIITRHPEIVPIGCDLKRQASPDDVCDHRGHDTAPDGVIFIKVPGLLPKNLNPIQDLSVGTPAGITPMTVDSAFSAAIISIESSRIKIIYTGEAGIRCRPIPGNIRHRLYLSGVFHLDDILMWLLDRG